MLYVRNWFILSLLSRFSLINLIWRREEYRHARWTTGSKSPIHQTWSVREQCLKYSEMAVHLERLTKRVDLNSKLWEQIYKSGRILKGFPKHWFVITKRRVLAEKLRLPPFSIRKNLDKNRKKVKNWAVYKIKAVACEWRSRFGLKTIKKWSVNRSELVVYWSSKEFACM